MTLDLQTWPCAPSLLHFGAAPCIRPVPRICSRTSTVRLAAPLSPPGVLGCPCPIPWAQPEQGGPDAFPYPRKGMGAPFPATS